MRGQNFNEIIPLGIYNVSPAEPCGPYGWWGEQSLDMAAVHGAAPGANILYVGSRDCNVSLNVALYNVLYNHLADVVTNSWTYNGEATNPGDLSTFDQAAMAGAAQGITVLFSSGDGGDLAAANGIASGSFPATSAWVTGVGGTSLLLEDSVSGAKSEYGWGTYRAYLDNAMVNSATSVTTSGLAQTSAYGYTFDHEFQWMAAKGYVVLYPNPRGSTTYGQDFGNIIQYHYPGDDYKDLMAGVDDLIKRGWVDPNKLAVTGGSGGGVLTNWVVGHTDRFKAAVSQRSIADWGDFWYTADFTQFTSNWFRGAPWESEADFKERSPITYIQNVHTPLMLVEGESDFRTPPASGGEQMFRALKYLKRPVVMVRFPGESHELSRSGKPTHRVERLEHIVAWFDKWVQGENIHTYDIQ